MTEQALWPNLDDENIRQGGEWIETRLLASSKRTNPLMQECSSRVLQAGELRASDTDMVGLDGNCSDLSRTWTVGHTRPSDERRTLYEAAYPQVHYNMDLLKPGMSFREFSERAWKTPACYLLNRYSCIAHGIGMVDEWPVHRASGRLGARRLRRHVRDRHDALRGELYRRGRRPRGREAGAA